MLLCAYTIFNVQLLLLSNIGQPYDPVANRGVIGRNFTHQTISDVVSFFDPQKFIFNPFIASGAIGMCIDEFNGDNFDHGPHGFVGGGYMGQVQTNGRPIETTPVPPGTPKWGAKWKQAVKENYLSATKPGTGVHGSMYSYRDVYLDLDPTYKDRFGRPLVRITMDFHENELKQNRFLTDRFAEIFQAMGARQMDKQYRRAPYDITDYQTTHLCGGAIMGTDPKTSALNRYLQSWDVPNLFVIGASAFPQNAGYNPTGTVAALAYWSAEAIRTALSQESRCARARVSTCSAAAANSCWRWLLLAASLSACTHVHGDALRRSTEFRPRPARPLPRNAGRLHRMPLRSHANR